MIYKTTVIKCTFDKATKLPNLPVMEPPNDTGGWSIVNFQPCINQTTIDSHYLVVWEKDD